MYEMEQSWIEQLNRRARQYQDAGLDSYGAIAQAAADFKLSVLVEGDACRVYGAPDGILVSCWINDDGSDRAEGSPSLANNIQWYTSTAV